MQTVLNLNKILINRCLRALQLFEEWYLHIDLKRLATICLVDLLREHIFELAQVGLASHRQVGCRQPVLKALDLLLGLFFLNLLRRVRIIVALLLDDHPTLRLVLGEGELAPSLLVLDGCEVRDDDVTALE